MSHLQRPGKNPKGFSSNFSSHRRPYASLFLTQRSLAEILIHFRSILFVFVLSNHMLLAQTLPIADPEKELKSLNGLFLGKQYAEAAEGYSIFLTNFPWSPDLDEATYKLGYCYQQLNRLPEALTAYSSLLSAHDRSPFSVFAKIRKGEILSKQGKESDALTLFNAVIREAPAASGLKFNAQFAAARSLQKLGKIEEMLPLLQALTQAQTNNPYRPFAELSLGRYFENLNETNQALFHYQAALALAEDPTLRAEAGVRAGNMALRLEQWQEAAALFETIRRLEIPEEWRRHANIGLLRARFAIGEYAEVLKIQASSPLMFPDNVQAEILYYLANAKRLTRELTAALADYDQLKEKFPDSPYLKAASYERLLILNAQKSETIGSETKAFLEVHADSPHVPAARVLLVHFLFSKQDYKSAIPILEQIVETKEPTTAQEDAWFQLSWSYYALKQFDQAVSSFEKFLKNYPKSSVVPEALWRCALAMEHLSQTNAALEKLDELAAKYPHAPQTEKAIFYKATLLRAMNKLEESYQTFSHYLQTYTNGSHIPAAQYGRGAVAFDQKKFTEAMDDLVMARKADASFEGVATERLMLAAYESKKADKLAIHIQEWDEWLAKHSQAKAKPANPTLLYWLAEQYQKQKKWELAETWFERVIKEGPPSLKSSARLQLGIVQLQLKRYAMAVQNIEKFRIETPVSAKSVEVLLPLGKSYLGAQHYSETRSLAEEIMAGQPEGRINAEARILLADAFFGQSNFVEAAKYYNSVFLLYDEKELTDLAGRKAIEAYKKAGNLQEAEKLERQIAKEEEASSSARNRR